MTDALLPSRQVIEVETEYVGRASVNAVYNQPASGGSVPSLLDYRGGTYGGDPSGSNSSAAAVSRFFYDCSVERCNGVLADGLWALDSSQPAYMGEGAGAVGAIGPGARLGYLQSGAFGEIITSYVQNPGCTFLIDVLGPNRAVPKIAMQGFNTLANVSFVGADLRPLASQLEVGGYPTIEGDLPNHAEPIIMDYAHDYDGSPLSTPSKSGSILMQNIRGTGLRRFVYLGDGLAVEEPMLAPYFSQAVTGIEDVAGTGDIRIDGFSGEILDRALAFAHVSSGGLRVSNVSFIPPYWQGISQPRSAGPEYKLLKWAQQKAVFCHGRHRAVGLSFENVGLRGFRAGWFFEAGKGKGPNGQDTGKYNSVRLIRVGVERVITILDVAENAYCHQLQGDGYGHHMDEYNLGGESRPVFWFKTDKNKAGAVDKKVGTLRKPNFKYYNGDKVQGLMYPGGDTGLTPIPGYIFEAQNDGTTGAGIGPTSTTIGADTVDGTVTWRCRNPGWKPLGNYGALGQIELKWRSQECAGALYENTVNDGHTEVDLSGSKTTNWGQYSSGSHSAAVIERSGIVVVKTMNTSWFRGGSDKVYDFTDWTCCRVGGGDYYGWEATTDGAGNVVAPAALGPPLGFSWPNCAIHNFAVDNGGDPSDPDDD